MDMEKVIPALLLIVFMNSAAAQKRLDTSVKKIPALQKTTMPVKNASKVIPKYPDIIITSLQVQKGGVSGFYATFTLKNIGNAPVKKDGFLFRVI